MSIFIIFNRASMEKGADKYESCPRGHFNLHKLIN
uniref:Uncharacterized protein n=1 Tax=Rhizophora mucronata TaxID=61149 RepID=A0A2P2PYN5_RHIMU